MMRRIILLWGIILLVPFALHADIWKRHVNSNRCDQLLGNSEELWVRSEGGGLTRWDVSTGDYTRYFDTKGLPSSQISDMTFDDEGRLIILESNHNIFRDENGGFTLITETPVVLNMLTFTGGELIGGYSNNNYMQRWDGENWSEIPGFSEFTQIRSICGDQKGGFWASTEIREGMERTCSMIYYKDGMMTSYSADEVTGGKDVDLITLNIVVDSDGIVWACLRGGVAWFDGSSWQQYYWDVGSEDISPFTKNVVKDNEGFIWVADGHGDLRRFDGENYLKVPEFEDSEVLWVENKPGGGIWVGTTDSLELFNGSVSTPYFIDNLLPISNYLNAVDIDPDGNLWCGDRDGALAMLERNNWKQFHGTDITGSSWGDPGALQNLRMSNFSGIWTVFDFEVLNYRDNIWVSYAEELEPISPFKAIEEGPDGSIWVASRYGSGLARFDGSEWETFYVPFSNINDMAFDKDGNLWVVTQNSLVVWDGEEGTVVLTDRDFETSFQPEVITIMNDGSVWIGGPGFLLVLYDYEMIHYFDAENGYPIQLTDGTWEMGINAIEQTWNGSIWVLGKYGLAHYDGTNFRAYSNNNTGLMTGGKDLAIDSSGRLFIVGTSGLTEFTPTSVTLKMNLFADKVMYDAGDELTLSLMVNNYGPDETGDLYFVMVSPEGKVYSAPEWSESVHPAASGITIPEGFRMPMMPVLTLSLPSEAPPISAPGQYLFAVALADSGTIYFRAKAIATIEVQ